MCAEMTRERAEEFGAARNSSAVRMFVFEHKPRDARVLEQLSGLRRSRTGLGGPWVMPRGLRVAATCVRPARPGR